ncbi:Receptor activity-modifying protein 1 [Labeo rohita]|uniref:Receptor activity-modifying protein 1 n=1 Tax=Labeo rohita TaxID=84645 RepID=A0ABQ8LE67_LABRO|nr:Receptor activity-modifying protein 1 [Labeo rohita]
MFYLPGLLLLLLDPSVFGGQTRQDNITAIEDESIRVKNESVQQELNKSLNADFQTRYHHCHEDVLKVLGEYCRQIFSSNMSELGEENWCNMEMVIRHYNKLDQCMDFVSTELDCFYPNRVTEQLFVRIHQQYFSHCSNEEDLSDAPAGVVLVSTLLPILLLPFIVYIVVWKSSLRD